MTSILGVNDGVNFRRCIFAQNERNLKLLSQLFPANFPSLSDDILVSIVYSFIIKIIVIPISIHSSWLVGRNQS